MYTLSNQPGIYSACNPNTFCIYHLQSTYHYIANHYAKPLCEKSVGGGGAKIMHKTNIMHKNIMRKYHQTGAPMEKIRNPLLCIMNRKNKHYPGLGIDL